VLARAAARSEAARRGLPAHISLLYPFLPADELDGDTVAEIAAVLEDRPEIEVRFERCHHTGGFVFLRPEPARPLTELVAALRDHWPHLRPYGGRFGDAVEPHLTIAMGASPQDCAALAASLAPALPVTARLTEAWLATFAGQWRLLRRFRFQRPPDPI
jgi:hypothetical protein